MHYKLPWRLRWWWNWVTESQHWGEWPEVTSASTNTMQAPWTYAADRSIGCVQCESTELSGLESLVVWQMNSTHASKSRTVTVWLNTHQQTRIIHLASISHHNQYSSISITYTTMYWYTGALLSCGNLEPLPSPCYNKDCVILKWMFYIRENNTPLNTVCQFI